MVFLHMGVDGGAKEFKLVSERVDRMHAAGEFCMHEWFETKHKTDSDGTTGVPRGERGERAGKRR